MTNDGFANFINTATGEKVRLPAHYADLFDTLELTDEDVECVDCVTPEPEPDETEPPEASFETFTDIAISEPARRTRRNNGSA